MDFVYIPTQGILDAYQNGPILVRNRSTHVISQGDNKWAGSPYRAGWTRKRTTAKLAKLLSKGRACRWGRGQPPTSRETRNAKVMNTELQV